MGIETTAPPTTFLGAIARFIRSKNAGPFWITVDIFFDDPASFHQVKNSGAVTEEIIADIYRVPGELVSIFFIADLNVVKISYPRTTPQGSVGDRDMHAAQQYIPLESIEIPAP